MVFHDNSLHCLALLLLCQVQLFKRFGVHPDIISGESDLIIVRDGSGLPHILVYDNILIFSEHTDNSLHYVLGIYTLLFFFA